MKQRFWLANFAAMFFLAVLPVRADVFSPGRLDLGSGPLSAATVNLQNAPDAWPSLAALDAMTTATGHTLLIPGNTVVAAEPTSAALRLTSGDYFAVVRRESPGQPYPLRLSILRPGDRFLPADGRMKVAPSRDHLPLSRDSGARVPVVPDAPLAQVLPRAIQILYLRQIPHVMIVNPSGETWELRRDEKSALFAAPAGLPEKITAVNLLLDRRSKGE